MGNNAKTQTSSNSRCELCPSRRCTRVSMKQLFARERGCAVHMKGASSIKTNSAGRSFCSGMTMRTVANNLVPALQKVNCLANLVDGSAKWSRVDNFCVVSTRAINSQFTPTLIGVGTFCSALHKGLGFDATPYLFNLEYVVRHLAQGDRDSCKHRARSSRSGPRFTPRQREADPIRKGKHKVEQGLRANKDGSAPSLISRYLSMNKGLR